jgi:restriction endonuclease Mrr
VAMGYGGTRKDVARAIARSGDEGIDGIIKEDPLCLDVVYFQSFAASLDGFAATKKVCLSPHRISREMPKSMLIGSRSA